MYDKKPIHECLHKDVDQCHHTYVTEFEPIQEEVCDENYQKSCQVSSNIHSRKIIFIFHSTDLFIIKTCCTQVFAITFTNNGDVVNHAFHIQKSYTIESEALS